jgi:phosphatidylserine/phosphatidylglycerophosphate/cardiolipin synthase-like enzyme
MIRNACLFLLSVLIFTTGAAHAQSKIKIYFTQPVDNSVSTGVNAIYVPGGHCADTIAAYIDRAKSTVDIAQYEFLYSTTTNVIINAINNAKARGVMVRYIYDSTESNTALSYLSSGIHLFARPSGSGGSGIMHNKFIIVDANSADPNVPVVCTGSDDWDASMFKYDYNNVLFIQDKPFAQAFTDEFNMMWGGTDSLPNKSAAKFGTSKTDLGLHTFTIGGSTVNLYFSPSDGTNTQIVNAIESANTDLYVGMYAFTVSTDASDIVSKKLSGVYTHIIVDSYGTVATSGSAYPTLTGVGSSNIEVFTKGYYYYHNKYMIVDPSNICSDPLVLTGSHNWTNSADTKNDENTLIIHNDTVANIYYQAFKKDYTTIHSGSISSVKGCPAGLYNLASEDIGLQIYPNPAAGEVHIAYTLSESTPVSITVSNMLGQKLQQPLQREVQEPGAHTLSLNITKPGVYFVQCALGDRLLSRKLIVSGL